MSKFDFSVQVFWICAERLLDLCFLLLDCAKRLMGLSQLLFIPIIMGKFAVKEMIKEKRIKTNGSYTLEYDVRLSRFGDRDCGQPLLSPQVWPHFPSIVRTAGRPGDGRDE